MKNLKKTGILLIVSLFLMTFNLFSQNGSAVVVYAEGDGFTLVREGENDFFEIDYDDVLGMFLYEGDTILTEENTFIEIQVTSNASLIKIAENTTFEFESIGMHGGGTLKVVYGRIRAKVNKLTNDDEFQVLGTDTVAGVRGTDFGFDLTFGDDFSDSESNEAITSVYCFEGSVQVEQENSETKEIKEVIIGVDQMVVTSSEKQEAPLTVYDIDVEIDRFWEENRFVYEMAEEPVIVTLDDYNADDYLTDYSDKIFGQKRRLENTGGSLAVAGIIIGAGGGVAYGLMDDKGLGVGLITIGTASFIAGTIFLLQSTTLPDPPEGWVATPVESEIPAHEE